MVDARGGPFHEAIRKLTGGQGVVGYTAGLPVSMVPHELVRNELAI